MNRQIILSSVFLAITTGCSHCSRFNESNNIIHHHIGGNPVIREGSADPSVRVFEGKVYIYSSHDYSRDNVFWIMKDWKVYSSTDLVNFTDHGVVLKGSDIPWAKAPDHCWAPDCAEKNGRWYFYFPVSGKQGVWKGEIGVATGDSPAGPFREVLGKPLIGEEDRPEGYNGSYYNIDPAVFTDTDGRSYLFWGNGCCFVAELDENMVSLQTEIRQVAINGHKGYMEGPFVWKRNGTYYLLYSRVGSTSYDTLDYATSGQPMGPYRYRGSIVGHGQKGNIHGSVFEFNGQWYVAYHDLFPTDKYRMTCLERIHYRRDGSIVMSPANRAGVGWYNAGERIEAEDYFEKDPEAGYSGFEVTGFYMAGMRDGQWLRFPNAALPYDFSNHLRVRLSLRGEAGSLLLFTERPEGRPVAEIRVPGPTKPGSTEPVSWQVLDVETGPVTGIQNLYITINGGETTRVDLDWFQLY